MNRKILGITLVSIFLILTVSGIVMYFFPFNKTTASLHTLFALFFLGAMSFHLINNKKPLFKYITGQRQSISKKLYSPIIFSFILLLAVGIYYNVPFLNGIYNWGNEFRNEQLGLKENQFEFQVIDLKTTTGNRHISLELTKGETFQYPLFAVWLEDSSGNYIETLYISRVMSSSTFDYGKKVGDKWKPAVIRRPEALPYWSHKRGIQASDGLYIPLDKSPDLDAVSGATPTNNFIVNSKTNLNENNNFRVLVELNQSFDWNEYYTENTFPDDKIYSGSGKVGQPSLIYAAEFNTKEINSKLHKIMKLIGHGHHSGKDGKLYTNLENITTAKNIADRIILSVE